MAGSRIKTNERKMVNSHNVSIVRERYHSKECGHDNFHDIDIVLPKDQIEIQGDLDYHKINTYNFPSRVIGNLGRIPKGSLMVLLKANKCCVIGTR